MLVTAEYGSSVKITEKSDVYSYGVVLLEIITGKEPVVPTYPESQHVNQWVRAHLKRKQDPVDIIDAKLQGHPDAQIQEIIQALGIALLCTSERAEDRPTMNDVATLLKEIRHDSPAGNEAIKPAASKLLSKTSDVASYTSTSVTPAQLMQFKGSSNSSLAYSSSSANYPSRN